MRLILIIPFLCIITNLKSQDAIFSLPSSATAYNNASLVDYGTSATFKMAYRLQWPKLDGGYSQYYSEYSHYIHKLRGYITAYGLYENNYAISKQSYFLNYTQEIRVSKNIVIKPSFGGGFFIKKIDWDVLSFGDMIDPRVGFIYNSNDAPIGGKVNNVDFNTGLGAKIYFFTIGFSVSHLTQPDESLTKGSSPLPMRFGIQIGLDYIFAINRQLSLKAQPFFRFDQQSVARMLQYGSTFEAKGLRVGFGIRQKDAINFLIGCNHKYFAINFCYDKTTSQLAGLTGGSYEISTVFKMGKANMEKRKIKFLSLFSY